MFNKFLSIVLTVQLLGCNDDVKVARVPVKNKISIGYKERTPRVNGEQLKPIAPKIYPQTIQGEEKGLLFSSFFSNDTDYMLVTFCKLANPAECDPEKDQAIRVSHDDFSIPNPPEGTSLFTTRACTDHSYAGACGPWTTIEYHQDGTNTSELAQIMQKTFETEQAILQECSSLLEQVSAYTQQNDANSDFEKLISNIEQMGATSVCDLILREDALRRLSEDGNANGEATGEDDGKFPTTTHLIAGGALALIGGTGATMYLKGRTTDAAVAETASPADEGKWEAEKTPEVKAAKAEVTAAEADAKQKTDALKAENESKIKELKAKHQADLEAASAESKGRAREALDVNASRAAELNRQAAELEAKRERLDSRSRSLDDAEDFEEENERLRAEKEELAAEKEQLATEKQRLQAENTRLEAEAKSTGVGAGVGTTTTELEAKHQKELADLGAKNDRAMGLIIDKNKADLKAAEAKHKKALDAKTAELKTAISKEAESAAALKKAEAESAQLRRKLEAQESALKLQEEYAAEANSAVVNSYRAEEDLSKKNSDLSTRLATAEAEAAAAKSRLEAKGAEMAELREKVRNPDFSADKQKELQSKLKQLGLETDSLKLQRKIQIGIIQGLRQETLELARDLEKAQAATKAAETKAAGLEADLAQQKASFEAEKKELNNRIAAQDSEIRKQGAELATLRGKEAEFKAESVARMEAQKAAKAARDEVERLKGQLAEAIRAGTAGNADLQAQLGEAEAKLAENRSAVENARADYQRRWEELKADKTAEIKKLEAEKTKTERELKDALAAKLAEAEAEAEYKATLTSTNTNVTDNQEAARKKIRELQNKQTLDLSAFDERLKQAHKALDDADKALFGDKVIDSTKYEQRLSQLKKSLKSDYALQRGSVKGLQGKGSSREYSGWDSERKKQLAIRQEIKELRASKTKYDSAKAARSRAQAAFSTTGRTGESSLIEQKRLQLEALNAELVKLRLPPVRIAPPIDVLGAIEAEKTTLRELEADLAAKKTRLGTDLSANKAKIEAEFKAKQVNAAKIFDASKVEVETKHLTSLDDLNKQLNVNLGKALSLTDSPKSEAEMKQLFQASEARIRKLLELRDQYRQLAQNQRATSPTPQQ